MNESMSRRAFFGLGATATAAAVATGTLTASTKAFAAEEAADTEVVISEGGLIGNPSEFTPAFLIPPAVPTEIVAEYDADVLIIGMGMSGTTAMKAAAEQGAHVIALETQSEADYMTSGASDFGAINCQIQKDLGITWAPKNTIMKEIEKECGWRPNPRLWNYWYENSGETMDWMLENADYEVLPDTGAEQTTDNPNFIRPKLFPAAEHYNYENEYYPYYHGTIKACPNATWVIESVRNDALNLGAEILYGTTGEQLITDENGSVIGAYAVDADGNYIKINAKAVVLTCGDYANNQEMRQYYCPQAMRFPCIGRTGQGHLMGMWVGARMEEGPHAPTAHHMGGVLGVDSFLYLNTRGERFMDEEIPGQNLSNAILRQPPAQDPELAEEGVLAWQIFDSKWPEQIEYMPEGHGAVTHYVAPEDVEAHKTVLEEGGWGFVSDALVEEQATVKADSLEELFELMHMDPETAQASIDRYNELCHAGEDADFGKDPSRMFPLENPPYYAVSFGVPLMLYIFGGLECDLDLRVLNNDYQPINGLYVAGNTMGGRFHGDKPVVVAGLGLSTATTFGRLAGMRAGEYAMA